MPPSPVTRYSPGRELRGENHKRGRSLESGFLSRPKDDDLELFNVVQTRERDNFLLQSNDDFEDTFSTKLRYFSDHKLGVSIPVRGEGSDLLNADVDKNDYDWLLTPPDTPLFTSLDDEVPPVNLIQRGRPRSQPISISRSSTMEKSYRSSRGSASPNRLSPSPRSGNTALQSRGRSSSAPNSSPTPSLHHVTQSRRPSPPSSKPSTPAPRSCSPAPRRISTGSNGSAASSGVRGVSPVKTSRGNSASPKIRAWQSNIPGFPSEVPPNLRTSLADRPASYVRGTSPASRNGRDSSVKSGRQSMSPSASRSVSSSYGNDRDRFSSHSKGSIASSGDDDADSPQSIPMGSSDRSTTRRVGASPNSRAPAFSKKPNRTLPSSSAPKRSFDSALRQMDNRKSPQNMFRPLLSSVPSSTFYVGKASAAHRALISRNSSVTTSSNASSDQATSGAHDTEGSEQNHEDVTSGRVKVSYPSVQDEVFVFDKVDVANEGIGHKTHDGSPSIQRDVFNEGPTHSLATIASSETLDAKDDFSDSDSLKDVLCSKCGRSYSAIETVEQDLKLCPSCSNSNIHLTIASPVLESTKTLEEYDSFDPVMATLEIVEVTSMGETRTCQHEEIVEEAAQTSHSEPIRNFSSDNSLAQPTVEKGGQRHSDTQEIGQPAVSQQMQNSSEYQNLKVDEGSGISVLLKRSSSGKGPVIQSRNFTASSISYEDPSYVGDSASSMRSSFGHGSASASSSLDLSSARQLETRVQRQLSGKKSDLENYRHDINTKHQRSVSSLSGTSNHIFNPLGRATSTREESLEGSVAHFEKEEVTCLANQEQLLASENMVVDGSTSELSSRAQNVHSRGSSVTSFSNFEESASYEIGEDLANHTRNIWDAEPSSVNQESSTVEEDAVPNSCVDRVDVAEGPTQNSLDTISEIEIESAHQGSDSQSDVSPNSKTSIDELQEPPVSSSSYQDTAASVPESDNPDHAHGILEESTVVVEAEGGVSMSRSLTLDEATDTILFCSSIIHNLAYEAANKAIEKENIVPLEDSKTMVLLGKANSDRKDPRGRTVAKRGFKSPKARQRRVEADTKPPPINTKSDERSDVSNGCIVGVREKDDSMKPPKLESKCNCSIM